MCAENPEKDRGDETLASAFAEKHDVIQREQNKVQFSLGLLSSRMKKLADRIGRSELRMRSEDEMSMGKAEANDAVKAFLKLQDEFGKLDAKKLNSLEQLEELESRLARLETIFDNPEKN